MSEDQQSDIFKEVLEKFESFCSNNSRIKELLHSPNISTESIDKLQDSLQHSEKKLIEIMDLVKTNKEEWIKNKLTSTNGVIKTNEQVKSEDSEQQQPKIGMLKLVSLDKLLDPSRLNDKNCDEPIIILSDGESESPVAQNKSLLPAEKGLKKVNPRIKIRPLRSRAKNTYVCDSDTCSEDEIQTKKYNRIKRSRQKKTDCLASDSDIVVTKKVKKVEDKQSEVKDSWKTIIESDKKLQCKAYVALPRRIECEKLQEVYLNNPSELLPKRTEHSYLKQPLKDKQNNANDGKNKITLTALLNSNSEDSTELNLSDLFKRNTRGSTQSNKQENKKQDDVDSTEQLKMLNKNIDQSTEATLCDSSENKSTEERTKSVMVKEKDDSAIASSNANSFNISEKTEATSKKEKGNSRKEADVKSSKEDASSSKSSENSGSEKEDSNKDKNNASKTLSNLESDNEKQDSSESEDFDFAQFSSKKDKRKRKKVLTSESENDSYKAVCDQTSSSDSENDSKKDKKTTRKRIRRIKNSSSEENSSDHLQSPEKSTRKQIRKVIKQSDLSESTKQAEKEERERKARILEKQKKYNQIFDVESLKKSSVDKLVLDFDEQTKNELLTVHKDLVKHLKPHQASGIKFMWDACFESLERTKQTGSGCILAHCMGLGKTLQVITLCHTLLMNGNKTGVEKVLVVCPLNTVLNWVAEFKQWLPRSSNFEVFEIVSQKQLHGRQFVTNDWFNEGGVLIIGYEMFRTLTNENNKRLTKKMRADFRRAFLDPGPDVVVCDEGHLLKNEKTSLSLAMNRMKTLRRIVLTGTPLQNNLKEYYCMVQFVKPNLLGTYKEYLNRFVNPITNGQYTNSTPMDIHIMRKRSHVLHKLLDGIVQRRDYNVLEPYLPPKYEYVLFLSLHPKQIELYRYYLNNIARNQDDSEQRAKSSFLFADFQQFQRICTHPKALQDKSLEDRKKERYVEEEDSEGSLKDFIDDGEDEDKASNDSSSGSDSGSEASIISVDNKKRKTRITRSSAAAVGGIDEIIANQEEEVSRPVEWWEQFLTEENLEDIHLSSKLFLLFEILAQCEAIGDKILVFSQSLYSLNLIECFLQKIDEATQQDKTCCGFTGSWSLGLDYFRIDGSSSCENRAAWCRSFNNPNNIRARLFLISTRAGGLGINLVAANRVIIFDVSWNPSHDTQSIYRVYRFGQTKPCYIYRFVTLGTMEMKVYERQVTKQAISKRVIDEQQIDRHYDQNDLMELYKFEPKPAGERPTPLVPKDVLLGELLQQFPDRIYKYHEHQSLLENKEDEVLDEEERKAAWEEFENEKNTRTVSSGYWLGIPMERATIAIRRVLQKDFPQLDQRQLNLMIIPKMKQVEVEITLKNNDNYNRIVNEIHEMQSEQDKMFREQYIHQQAIKMMNQQFALGGQNEYFNALQQQLRAAQSGNFGAGRNSVFSFNAPQPPNVSNEIIELNE